MRTYKATLYSLFPSKSVWEQSHVGSNPTRCATSEQAMYRLLRLFLKVRARSRRCSSFPNRNRLRWVAIWVRRCAAFFFLSQGNIDFNRPFHVGAKSALLRRLFMHEAKKTSSASSLAPPFQLRPAALGSRLAGRPAGRIPISAAPHESAGGEKGKVHNFCRKSSAISWAIRPLDRRFFSVINFETSSSSNAWKALCHTGAAFREPAGGASR